MNLLTLILYVDRSQTVHNHSSCQYEHGLFKFFSDEYVNAN
jgi:hypothetical protein